MKKTRKKCRALIPRSTRSAPTRLGYRNAGSQEHQSPNTFDELLKTGHAPINALRHSPPLGSLGEWRTAPGWEEGTILGLVHRPVSVSIENKDRPKLAWVNPTGGTARLLWRGRQLLLNGKSRVSREAQARICERLGVRFPGATRPSSEPRFVNTAAFVGNNGWRRVVGVNSQIQRSGP